MSTRYVWDKYNYEYVWVEKSSSGTFLDCQNNNTYVPTRPFVGSTGYRWDDANLRYVPSGSVGEMLYGGIYNTWDVWYIDAKLFPYITLTAEAKQGSYVKSPSGIAEVPTQRVVLYANTSNVISGVNVYWNFALTSTAGGYRDWRIVTTNSTVASGSTSVVPGTIRWKIEEAQATTKAGAASADKSNAYGNESVFGGYYWRYLGSDSIDPTAVSYSNTEPRAGETITVTVTPAKSLYGGTVSYQYQYAVNGGAWTNSGGKTTSVTKELTVPNGSAQFRVRVIASDDLGFTSTTYVYGANLPVVNMRAYLGVNDAARRVEKMYIGIDGKARKISKAYIGGADGKARLLF